MVESKTENHCTLLKIAIVEDSPIIVSRVQDMINELSGVEFLGDATSVDQAMDLLERTLPDVMIIDISLRNSDGKNGIMLLNMLKKLHPTIVVIMLSNLSNWFYRSQCATGGADFFLDKSDDFEKIPETLAAIARRRSIPLQ
jgi:DNA-binding NarL/FixJ family response regulator